MLSNCSWIRPERGKFLELTATSVYAGSSRSLSADKKKTYCLYEAPNAEMIRAAAKRLRLPADIIVEVSEVRPEAYV